MAAASRGMVRVTTRVVSRIPASRHLDHRGQLREQVIVRPDELRLVSQELAVGVERQRLVG